MTLHAEVDHLVVAAATLDDGARWCEATLGAVADAGGRHALMGTHNRLLAIASARFPRSYLEIIAIDRAVPAPARRRWFGLDDAALRARLERDGPQLVHWVARSADLGTSLAALRAHGADPGVPVAASRGAYRWRITLRDDGVPQCGGALPALIAWDGAAHPADGLNASGVGLVSLALGGLDAAVGALVGGAAVRSARSGPAALVAELSTPRGNVTLRSPA